jgi:Amt family ammonium transporter
VGCVAAMAAVWFVAGPAHASAMVAADTSWILTSTALVLFMNIPGLSCFYGGLVKRSSVLSVLMQCFAITCMISIIWFTVGYSLR